MFINRIFKTRENFRVQTVIYICRAAPILYVQNESLMKMFCFSLFFVFDIPFANNYYSLKYLRSRELFFSLAYFTRSVKYAC